MPSLTGIKEFFLFFSIIIIIPCGALCTFAVALHQSTPLQYKNVYVLPAFFVVVVSFISSVLLLFIRFVRFSHSNDLYNTLFLFPRFGDVLLIWLVTADFWWLFKNGMVITESVASYTLPHALCV